MSKNIAEQTQNAFEFIKKLYFEISYLIKEVEGLLQEEEERFVIGRPAGYGVTTRSATGLDPASVDYWLNKSYTVFFCPESVTEIKGGQSITPFTDDLKLLILHMRLMGKGVQEPQIYFGCIRDIRCKKHDYKKFELLMSEFAYYGEKIFTNPPVTGFEDGVCSFKAGYECENLFEINSSDEVQTKVIQPMLQLYRKI